MVFMLFALLKAGFEFEFWTYSKSWSFIEKCINFANVNYVYWKLHNAHSLIGVHRMQQAEPNYLGKIDS